MAEPKHHKDVPKERVLGGIPSLFRCLGLTPETHHL
jgi:hypothetical protein